MPKSKYIFSKPDESQLLTLTLESDSEKHNKVGSRIRIAAPTGVDPDVCYLQMLQQALKGMYLHQKRKFEDRHEIKLQEHPHYLYTKSVGRLIKTGEPQRARDPILGVEVILRRHPKEPDTILSEPIPQEETTMDETDDFNPSIPECDDPFPFFPAEHISSDEDDEDETEDSEEEFDGDVQVSDFFVPRGDTYYYWMVRKSHDHDAPDMWEFPSRTQTQGYSFRKPFTSPEEACEYVRENNIQPEVGDVWHLVKRVIEPVEFSHHTCEFTWYKGVEDEVEHEDDLDV